MKVTYLGREYEVDKVFHGDVDSPWWLIVTAGTTYLVQCRNRKVAESVAEEEKAFSSMTPVDVYTEPMLIDHVVCDGDVVLSRDGAEYELGIAGDEVVSVFEYFDTIIIVAEDPIHVRIHADAPQFTCDLTHNTMPGYPARGYVDMLFRGILI